MDNTVRFNGEYSKKGRRGHRVDYNALHAQLREFTYKENMLVYNLASHSDVLRFGEDVVNRYAAGLTRIAIKPDCVARGVDRVLLKMGRGSDILPAWKWRGKVKPGRTTLFPAVSEVAALYACAREEWRLSKVLDEKMCRGGVLWVTGPCGSGKSTRVPRSLGWTHENPDNPDITSGAGGGVAHCVPTNMTARTPHRHYCKQGWRIAHRVCRWHGARHETHAAPRTSRFVALCTPASLFHLLQNADTWNDIGFLVLDEV